MTKWRVWRRDQGPEQAFEVEIHDQHGPREAAEAAAAAVDVAADTPVVASGCEILELAVQDPTPSQIVTHWKVSGEMQRIYRARWVE